MRKETTYYAFDDTEFFDENECIAYEKHISDLFYSVDIFDSAFKRIGTTEVNWFDEHNVLEDAYYVVIKDVEKAKEFLRWASENYGYNLPDDGMVSGFDIIYYDEDDGEWVNLTKRYNELCDKLNKLRKEAGAEL